MQTLQVLFSLLKQSHQSRLSRQSQDVITSSVYSSDANTAIIIQNT